MPLMIYCFRVLTYWQKNAQEAYGSKTSAAKMTVMVFPKNGTMLRSGGRLKRLLQLNLFLSEWKGRVPFTFMSVSLALRRANHARVEGTRASPRSHCERITRRVGRRRYFIDFAIAPPQPAISDEGCPNETDSRVSGGRAVTRRTSAGGARHSLMASCATGPLAVVRFVVARERKRPPIAAKS
ncbi:hypothetical protein EVAR_51800_1 [Eumeta japonica]|uniref:Uncharacterized protein n=1 Tax=Eumeta variegata TaxID=151549 RepID=A0A4C2A7W9_EUMVA|nr:hypothetical protein EVAR_51800_1 [Eumeta japonica]